jgi:hypothetical protein
MLVGYLWGCPKERDHLEDQDVGGWMRLVGVDWIGLAQDRDRWRALVNTAMNLRVS